MKNYVRYSAAWKLQKETQAAQRAAAARGPATVGRKGQKYLHPERRRVIRGHQAANMADHPEG